MDKKEFTGMRYYKDNKNSLRSVILRSDWGVEREDKKLKENKPPNTQGKEPTYSLKVSHHWR